MVYARFALGSHSSPRRKERDPDVQVTGLPSGQPTWLLFWEDGWATGSYPYPGDGDFNDLVVEVTAIPEPATLLLLGLAALVFKRPRARAA